MPFALELDKSHVKSHDNPHRASLHLRHDHCAPCRGCPRPGGLCVEEGNPRYNSAWKPAGVQGGATRALEENCVFNADRIDHIEIIDGDGQGMGREYWKQDTLTVEQAIVAHGYAWCWYSDSDGGYQDVEVPYDSRYMDYIMEAYSAGLPTFRLSDTYTLYFDDMKQRRNDALSREREIKLITSSVRGVESPAARHRIMRDF